MRYANQAFQRGTFQEGWKLWWGVEQEGPYKGYKTLFVGSDCTLKEFEEVYSIQDNFEQIYINPGFVSRETIEAISKLDFSRLVMVTVIAENYLKYRASLPNASFMIILPEFPHLKDMEDGDVIRIDCGNMVTYSVQIVDMVRTSAASYKSDEQIL